MLSRKGSGHVKLASRYHQKLALLGLLATVNLWAQSKLPELFIIDGSTLVDARESYQQARRRIQSSD